MKYTVQAKWIDSEAPLADLEATWEHLKRRDNWRKPAGATADQVLFMTTCMETLIVADHEALEDHYGDKLQISALPPLVDSESRARHDVQDAKGKRSFEIPSKLKSGRFGRILAKLCQEPAHSGQKAVMKEDRASPRFVAYLQAGWRRIIRGMTSTWVRCILPFVLAGAAAAQQFNPDLFKDLHWRNIGPFRGRRTRAAAGVPSQPNVFYMGQVNGGVWKTDDYGRTWAPIFDSQPTGSIGAIAVAPSDPSSPVSAARHLYGDAADRS